MSDTRSYRSWSRGTMPRDEAYGVALEPGDRLHSHVKKVRSSRLLRSEALVRSKRSWAQSLFWLSVGIANRSACMERTRTVESRSKARGARKPPHSRAAILVSANAKPPLSCPTHVRAAL
jgi:hypothetical protein